MSSGLHLKADIARYSRHVSRVPNNRHPPRGGLSADHPPMGNRVGLILGAVQSRIAQFSRMLPTWIAKWSQEKPIMTDDQVNLVVQHLCEQLHLALRLKDSEAHPPNAKDIGFDPASVRTVLLTGLRSARVTIHHEAAGANEEPPWS